MAATSLREDDLRSRLRINAAERRLAAAELERLRRELAGLLKKGKRQGLSLRSMATEANIGHERAAEMVRGAVRRSREVMHTERRKGRK